MSCFPLKLKYIEKNLNYFLTKLNEMLEFQQQLPQETKGRRTFSLLPLKNGFTMDYMEVTYSQLPSLLSRLEVRDRRVILERVMDIVGDRVEERILLEKVLEKPNVTIDNELFSQSEWIGT
jgi:hypothetical protein